MLRESQPAPKLREAQAPVEFAATSGKAGAQEQELRTCSGPTAAHAPAASPTPCSCGSPCRGSTRTASCCEGCEGGPPCSSTCGSGAEPSRSCVQRNSVEGDAGRREHAEQRREGASTQSAPRSGGTGKPHFHTATRDRPARLRGAALTVRPAPARSGCARRAPCGAAHPPASAGCCRRARASPRAGSPASRGPRPRPGQAQEGACEACSWKGSERREIVNNEREVLEFQLRTSIALWRVRAEPGGCRMG